MISKLTHANVFVPFKTIEPVRCASFPYSDLSLCFSSFSHAAVSNLKRNKRIGPLNKTTLLTLKIIKFLQLTSNKCFSSSLKLSEMWKFVIIRLTHQKLCIIEFSSVFCDLLFVTTNIVYLNLYSLSINLKNLENDETRSCHLCICLANERKTCQIGSKLLS